METPQEVDLDIQPGEFAAVVGASGCGKSTLLRIAIGPLAPGAGVGKIGGEPLTGPIPHIGMIFQCAAMLPWFTVLENVVLLERTAHQNLAETRAQYGSCCIRSTKAASRMPISTSCLACASVLRTFAR